jgi:hypothetical protein
MREAYRSVSGLFNGCSRQFLRAAITIIFTISCKESLPTAKVAWGRIGCDFQSAGLTEWQTAAM